MSRHLIKIGNGVFHNFGPFTGWQEFSHADLNRSVHKVLFIYLFKRASILVHFVFVYQD